MAASTTATGVAVKTLLIALFCVTIAAFVYLFVYGDLFSCFDMTARWALLSTADFTVFAFVFGAWSKYKETSWMFMIVLLALTYLFGSIAVSGYILTQFHKLSREEFLKDPLYFVLVRRHKRDVKQHATGGAVYGARAFFLILGLWVLGILIYTIIVDISPSYADKIFSGCAVTFITDLYILSITFSIWIAYKESSWTTAFVWIVLVLCFRGVTACVYILWELFHLSPQQPVSLIIFNSRNRDLLSSDPLMMAEPVQ